MMSHKEVQRVVRDFMEARGYKALRKTYSQISESEVSAMIRVLPPGLNKSGYDDIFVHPTVDGIICEYKPTPITKGETMRGIGQVLTYSVESGLRCYLVVSESDYINTQQVLDKAPYVGLLIYRGKRIISWRRPIDMGLLPNPNELQEV